jgi:hypothetical protein
LRDKLRQQTLTPSGPVGGPDPISFPIVDSKLQYLLYDPGDGRDLDLAKVLRNGLHAVRTVLLQCGEGAVADPVVS